MVIENLKIRRYLLGVLTKSEAEEIDLQVISDAELDDRLRRAEDELVEDYLERTLTAEEIELFHQNFLVSGERKRLLRELSLIKNYAKSVGENPAAGDEVTGENFFQTLKNWFSINLHPASAVFGLLLLGLLAFGAWQIFNQNSLSPLEADYAALNQKDLVNPAEFQNYSNINLSSGTFRNSGDSIAKTKSENLTESIFFRLALPFQAKSGSLFRVQVLRDGTPVFRQDEIRFYQNENGQEVRMLLPKSVFAKGQYQIRLENPASGDSTVIYNFSVE